MKFFFFFFGNINKIYHIFFIILIRYGVLCVKKNQKKKAIQLLTRSVKLYPYNWSAWLELASCLITQELVIIFLICKKILNYKIFNYLNI